MNIMHLAIPTHDLNLCKDFYTKSFGASIGRQYDHYVIFNFFGHQLVPHLHPDKIDQEVKMYPRHFGIILNNRADFEKVYKLCQDTEAPFFEELFERYQNQHGWHLSFFVSDPSNNLIEVKHYINKSDIFA